MKLRRQELADGLDRISIGSLIERHADDIVADDSDVEIRLTKKTGDLERPTSSTQTDGVEEFRMNEVQPDLLSV